MQPLQQLPIFSDVADVYHYPVLTSSQDNAIVIDAAGGTNNGYVTLANENYFALMGWVAVTNYDNFGGVFATADSTAILVSPPTVPNAFTVQINRSGKNLYSQTPLTQAELCSSGYLSGKQMPLPVIYGPSITFDFQFSDLTGLALIDGDDAPIPLSIQLWMVGVHIRKDNFPRFVNYFPGLQVVY